MDEQNYSELSSTELEIWVDIPDFDNFQVSNLGRVRSKAKTWTCGNGAIRIQPEREVSYSIVFSRGSYGTHGSGYKRVILIQDNKRKVIFVHRLVAELFIPNPYNKPQVDHLDRNSLNNCVSNLRWCTAKENCANRGGIYGK